MSLDVTAISVLFGNEGLLACNGQLSDAMNCGQQFRWIAVENQGTDPARLADLARFTLCPGKAAIPESESLDRGSLHHAQGLMAGCKGVRTRFLLTIDPDFYVVRRNWMEDVLATMHTHNLTLFGSCWHPRWWYQYRGFPTVHFMLIDLQRLPLDELDFTPGMREHGFYRTVTRATWLPAVLSRLLRAGRLRDTGYRIRKKVLADGGHRYETLVPHYIPEWSHSHPGRLLRRLSSLLPDSLRNKRSYTEESFLRQVAPQGYAAGWEEFFWQGRPFAIHLRNVGRGLATTGSDPELRCLLGSAPYS